MQSVKRNRTIAVFCGYYLPHLGGVERYVDKLSSSLINLGYSVIIVTTNHANLPPIERVGGRKVYRLPIRSFAKNRYPIPFQNKEYKALKYAMNEEGIDYYILNTRFHLTSLIGARMAKKQKKPVLLIEHGTGHFTVNNMMLDVFGVLYEHILSSAIKYYVKNFYGVSQKCNNWLRHFSITARGVIYNAINSEDEKCVKDAYKNTYPKNKLVIVYAGRLIKEKGVLNLLEAFLEISPKYPNAQLVIAGDGDLMQDIKKNYTHPQIDVIGKINFDHIMALYKRGDIFVHPSLYPEGLPTSILEAGLMQCAVIATPKGGTEEVITNSEQGIIISGSKDSIKEAIELLANDAVKRDALGKNLKHRIQTVFDWKIVAAKLSNELESLGDKNAED